MIDFLSGWAKNLGVVMVLVSIFEMLLPQNKTKKYIRMVLGIFVVFNIISPLINNKDKFSLASINIEEYETKNNTQVNQTSMDERIKELYEEELEKDIKEKLEEKGYKTQSCKVKTTEDEKTIEKISLKISKNQEDKNTNQTTEDKVVSKIQEIKAIDTNVSNTEKLDSNQDNKITKGEIQNIKKFLIEEYGVKEKCLEIN